MPKVVPVRDGELSPVKPEDYVTASTGSDWGDISPHKKIPRKEFKRRSTEVKARAQLEQITKEGDLLKWFWTGPAAIGKYSQSLGLELYFRFVKNACRVWFICSLLYVPLLIACALPSASDGKNGVSALSIFTLASFGESHFNAATSAAPAASSTNTTAATSTAAAAGAARRLDAGAGHGGTSGGHQHGGEAQRRLSTTNSGDRSADFRKQKITYKLKDWFGWLDPNAQDLSFEMEQLTPLLSLYTASGSMLFFFFVLWFRHRTIGVAAEKLDAASITPSDFTVMIDKLPKFLYDVKSGDAQGYQRHREYKKQLTEHIEKVLNAERDKRRNKKKCFGLVHAPEFVPAGRAVVEDISLVYDFDGKLKHHIDDARLKGELASAQKWDDTKRVRKLEAKIAKVVRKRARQHKKARKSYAGKTIDQVEKTDRKVLRAYVTLGQAFDVSMMLHLYKFADYGVLRCFQGWRKRFFGHRIRVRAAPEPTNILWENQDISVGDWTRRRAVTSVITLVIIAVSITMIMLSKTYGDAETQRLNREAEDDDAKRTQCPEGQPTVWATPLTGQLVPLDKDTGLAWIQAQVAKNKSWDHKNAFSTCQCSAISQLALAQNTLLRSACWDFLTAKAFLLGTTIGASLIVIIINVVLKGALTKLSKWERPLTISALECSIVSKIFVAQFLNTGIIILILNSKRLFGAIFGGDYDDFTQRWYATVGGAIAMTMAINVLSPHMIAVVTARIKKCKVACCAACCVNTINGLRNVYDPPPYELAARAGALLNTIFCTLTYAPGCPILVPFAFLNFLLVYNCDKFVLLRVSKRPPAWDALVIETMCNIMRSALLLHAIFGVWMLGNQDIFPSVDYYGMDPIYNEHVKEYVDKARTAMGGSGAGGSAAGAGGESTRWNGAQAQYFMATFIGRALSGGGLPYFALFLLVLLYFVLRLVAFVFTSTIGTVVDVLYQTCCKKQRVKMDHAEDHVNWREAKSQMEDAKIVTSYMVEKHPHYARMFEDVDFDAPGGGDIETGATPRRPPSGRHVSPVANAGGKAAVPAGRQPSEADEDAVDDSALDEEEGSSDEDSDDGEDYD